MSLRVGIEFEWLAPKGLSRQTYAQYLATQIGGSVQSFWHPQVEPAKVPGTPLFHNLTQGFAFDADGSKLVIPLVIHHSSATRPNAASQTGLEPNCSDDIHSASRSPCPARRFVPL